MPVSVIDIMKTTQIQPMAMMYINPHPRCQESNKGSTASSPLWLMAWVACARTTALAR